MKAVNSRSVFFGTPRFAVTVLTALEEHGVLPSIVVTAPDRPAGRGLKLTPPPIKGWAAAHDIPCLQPASLKEASEELAIIQNSDWDVFLVAAYGKILPQSILDIPHHGTLNVHPSLLPRFRGASPIEAQILADERTVGVSIMQIDAEMDHGPLLAQASVTLDEWPIRARDLEVLLAAEGGALLSESLPAYLNGGLVPSPQDHAHATFCKKIKKEDGLIDLSIDGYQNYLKYCAYDEWPGTFFFKNGVRMKITEADFENGLFMPIRVIPEGKAERLYKS